MTALAPILRAQIAASGPLTVAQYMATCLLHPVHGYYTTAQPFGMAGDFVTAPEISQMFGELIGLSLAQAWMDQGAPTPFALAELGPGRGTLMADILRATARVPGFHAAAQIVLVEASPTLRATQRATLGTFPVSWADTIEGLPDVPLFLVANEFFDALPIRQFIRRGDGWAERVIGLADDALSFGETAAAPQAALVHRLTDTRDGDLVETCAPAQAIAARLGGRIAAHGGAALLIDYGDWHTLGDTLQAVKAHQTVSPLATPGQCDLTAHVDFEALAQAVPCRFTRLTPQGIFLERLGITQRAQSLAHDLQGATLKQHIAAHRRLTHPGEMGTLFKILGLYPDGSQPPPGLDS